MQNAQEIYQQSVRPLPDEEKLRLAAMILENLDHDRRVVRPALEILNDLPAVRAFRTAKDVDEHLNEERDSWNN